MLLVCTHKVDLITSLQGLSCTKFVPGGLLAWGWGIAGGMVASCYQQVHLSFIVFISMPCIAFYFWTGTRQQKPAIGIATNFSNDIKKNGMISYISQLSTMLPDFYSWYHMFWLIHCVWSQIICHSSVIAWSAVILSQSLFYICDIIDTHLLTSQNYDIIVHIVKRFELRFFCELWYFSISIGPKKIKNQHSIFRAFLADKTFPTCCSGGRV